MVLSFQFINVSPPSMSQSPFAVGTTSDITLSVDNVGYFINTSIHSDYTPFHMYICKYGVKPPQYLINRWFCYPKGQYKLVFHKRLGRFRYT